MVATTRKTKPLQPRICKWCKKEFFVPQWKINAGLGVFCSGSCKGRLATRKHGHNGLIRTKTYDIWAAVLARTRNPRNAAYKYYGGRGITVCERWLKFENFLADMGVRPDGMSIERIDNNKGYSPDNCKWATRSEQMRNTRSNHLLTYNGRTQCLADWEKETGIADSTIAYRIRHGYDPFVRRPHRGQAKA